MRPRSSGCAPSGSATTSRRSRSWRRWSAADLRALRELALSDLAEAPDLREVEPVALERRRRRQLEAADHLGGHEAPAAVVADEVSADLEVALPREVRCMVVRGQAGEPRLERGAGGGALDTDPLRIRIDRDRDPHREREPVRRDDRENHGLIMRPELLDALVPHGRAVARTGGGGAGLLAVAGADLLHVGVEEGGLARAGAPDVHTLRADVDVDPHVVPVEHPLEE